MTLSDRNIISIVEVAAYPPLLLIAIFLAFRLGYKRESGWIFLVIFSLLRIIGAGLELGTISDPTNSHLIIGSAICSSIGLSPLFLASLGILQQVNDRADMNKAEEGNKAANTPYRKLSRALIVVIIIALVLGIVGGVKAGNDFKDMGAYNPPSESKAAAVVFAACFIGITIATVFTLIWSGRTRATKSLLTAVTVSLPLLLVRVAYSVASAFADSGSPFNVLSGKVWVLFGMSVIEEILVVVLYESGGLLVVVRGAFSQSQKSEV